MSETEKKKKSASKDKPGAQTGSAKTAPEPETKPEKPEAEQAKKTVPVEELEALKRQLSEETERVLRISAEYDNYKKRTGREKEELYDASLAAILTGLLPVFDNLERAGLCTDFDTLKSGVDMILNSFHSALDALGVTEIDALKQPFDPACHEAVLREERSDCEPGTVCEVLQKGYKIKDRVLRHAMVKVATEN